MKTLFRPVLMAAMLLLPMLAIASDKIGVVPLVKHGNETVLFVDADTGELLSFAVMDEPVFHAVVTEDGRYYGQTRHYLYEGPVASGEIQNRVQTIEIFTQEEGEVVDPNQTIFPLGVSRSGKALFSYNAESRELQLRNAALNRQMQGASAEKVQAISKEVMANTAKVPAIAAKQPVFVADFDGNVSHLKDLDMNTDRALRFDGDGVLQTADMARQIVRFTQLDGTLVNEIDPEGVFSAVPSLQGTVPGIPQVVASNVVYYPFWGAGGGVAVMYDVALGQVLQAKPVDMGFASFYPLVHENSPSYLYADKECSAGAMPALPDFGKPAGTSKKAMAEWQESLARKQTEHQKALAEWQKKASNPDNCTVSIYRDAEMKDKLVEIENTATVTIYNDRYALARRSIEVVMYDLLSGEQLWAIDTDF